MFNLNSIEETVMKTITKLQIKIIVVVMAFVL